MFPPDELKSDAPLVWSAGRGTDVRALFTACAAGDLDAVRRLLDRDPALVRSQYAYRTPLYFAVRENRIAVVALLLDRGADPLSLAVGDSLLEITRDRGYRELGELLRATIERRFNAGEAGEPAARAIREGDSARLRELLDAAPALLHTGDSRGNHPIHWAVMTRQPTLIDLLLERGADPNARRFDGARPIHLTNGDYHYRGWRDVPKSVTLTPDDVFRHLVNRGAEVDLGMAAARGDLARVRELVEREPALVNRVCEYGSYYLGCGAPLKNAAATGQLEIVRFLLEHGADPNLPEEGIAPNGHALYSAVAAGHHAIVRLLLAHGANPNAEVESSADALSRALDRGDTEMVDLLCAHGARRPVHLLAHYNDLRTAAAVFAANPALADDPHALGSAASTDFVRLMLRHQPDLPRRVRVTGDVKITELLLEQGMDPNRRDWLGSTSLHEFARRGDMLNAALFLRHGAEPEVRDEDSRSTPLALAAKFGRVRMVEFLLRHGARTRLPDDPAWAVPLAWAERRGHDVIASMLRHHEKWDALPLRRDLADFVRLAEDWQAACASDDPGARDRLATALELDRQPDRSQLREFARKCLRRPERVETLTTDEARRVVARADGFDSWDELEAHLGNLARGVGVRGR